MRVIPRNRPWEYLAKTKLNSSYEEYSNGRTAIFVAMAKWHEPGDVVLMPMYHCGAEVQACLDAGWDVHFYDRLFPTPAYLEHFLYANVKALYVIDHHGFTQKESLIRWVRKNNLVLIEDAAQAWGCDSPLDPDIFVTCPYKTFGGRKQGLLFEWGFLDYEKPSIAHSDFNVKRRRQNNYQWLYERFYFMVPRFFEPSSNASPFAFPVLTWDAPKLIQRMAEKNVNAFQLWRWPHAIVGRDSPSNAAYLRRNLVSLPVHQYLTQRSLDRIAFVLDSFTNGVYSKQPLPQGV